MTERTWGVWFEPLYNYTCPQCQKWLSVSTIKPVAGSRIICIHCKTESMVPRVWQTRDQFGVDWRLTDIRMIESERVGEDDRR